MLYSLVDSRTCAAMALLAAVVPAGCTPAPTRPAAERHDHDHKHGHKHDDDHDHGDHDHPATLAGGVDGVAKAVAGLREHLAADAHEKLDKAVHRLGHLLEDLQGLVNDSGLAADAKSAATKALDELFECIGTLDESLHADRGTGESPAAVHASIAKRVDDAVGALRAATQKEGQ